MSTVHCVKISDTVQQNKRRYLNFALYPILYLLWFPGSSLAILQWNHRDAERSDVESSKLCCQSLSSQPPLTG